MELVDRTLPTYPRHAARRGQEMAEVEKTLAGLGLCSTVVPGVRELTAALAERWPAEDGERAWGVTEVIEELDGRRLLRPDT
jgi:hypothetical protein